jgi:O-antigen/teichoic acid export membrane protein
VVLALNILWLRPYHPIDWRTNLVRLRQLLRESLVYAASAIFGMVYIWVGSVTLAAMAPPTTVGWYGASNRLFATLMFFPTIVATAWLPRLVKAYEQGPRRLHVAARAPVEMVLIISLPIAAGTALIADDVIRFLYGPAFGPSAIVLMILAASCVPMYFNIIAYQVLVAENRPGIWNRVMIAATVVNVVLNLVAISFFQGKFGNGAIGAALALLVTELLMSAVGVAVLKGVLARSSAVRFLKAVVATLGMSAAVLAATPWNFGFQALLGVIVFAGLAIVLRLPTAEEIHFLRHLAANIRRRVRVVVDRGREDGER